MYYDGDQENLAPCPKFLHRTRDKAGFPQGDHVDEAHFGKKNTDVTNLVAHSKGSVLCCVCKQPIKGLIVQALNKNWHPNHFLCQHCNKPIKEHKFNVYEGKPYCENDYAHLFLKRCNGCHLPIKDVVVVALNANWHREHFVCANCGTQLCNKGFFEKDMNPYCKKCFEDKYCPKCKGCDESITDTAVMALGEKWHQTCFLCKNCSRPITSGKFEVVNDKPLCDNCSQYLSKADHIP
ncbi:paxillin-like [Cimex lectularius]|uniref:LIM zinc-binding domain-containing protein n=1 Tax=Cimex lectularius TaxID=79782 RepID=A0A8I6R7W0_CIMLE|nr:paxillin-like [Cimex lectularius]